MSLQVYGLKGTVICVQEEDELRGYWHKSRRWEPMMLETDPPVIWENPFARYGFSGDDQIAVAAELWSIRKAVLEDMEPEYGAQNARKDQEIAMAIGESSLTGETVELPLRSVTRYEQDIHASYEQKYGRSPLEG